MTARKVKVFFSNSYPGSLPGQPGFYITTILIFIDPAGRLVKTVETLKRIRPKAQNVSISRLLTYGWKQKRLGLVERWLTFRMGRLEQKALSMTNRLLRSELPSIIELQSSTGAFPFTPIEARHEVEKVLRKLACGKDIAFSAPSTVST